MGAQFTTLAPGQRLMYDVKGGTGGGGKINRLFAPFGFRAAKDGLDGDHVMKRQIGGPDVIENLWPLRASENRSSSATVVSIEVRYRDAPLNVHVARRTHGDPLYLLIRSVKN